MTTRNYARGKKITDAAWQHVCAKLQSIGQRGNKNHSTQEELT